MKPKKLLLFSTLTFFVSTMMLIGATLAWFTNTQPIVNNIMTVGNLNVDATLYLAQEDVETPWLEVTKIDVSNMKPSDVLSYKLTLTNSGSLDGILHVGLQGFLDGSEEYPLMGVMDFYFENPFDELLILNDTLSTLVVGNQFSLVSGIEMPSLATYDLYFTFTFQASAGNEYQNGSLQIQTVFISLYQA